MGAVFVELADRLDIGLVELVVVGSLALRIEIEIEKLKQNKRVFF
jgi:regulator of sirC expression with transglutaminase-like and TPR domain